MVLGDIKNCFGRQNKIYSLKVAVSVSGNCFSCVNVQFVILWQFVILCNSILWDDVYFVSTVMLLPQYGKSKLPEREVGARAK